MQRFEDDNDSMTPMCLRFQQESLMYSDFSVCKAGALECYGMKQSLFNSASVGYSDSSI